MSPPSRVIVVTDQRRNNRCHLAFVAAAAREVWRDAAPPVRHVYVEKDDLRPDGARRVRGALHGRGVADGEILVLFRDSECRSAESLAAARRNVDLLAAALRSWFHVAFALAFNPMSEGAYLLFDQAADLLTERPGTSALRDLRQDKRANRFVNKDVLEAALGVAEASRELSSVVPSHGRTPSSIATALESGASPGPTAHGSPRSTMAFARSRAQVRFLRSPAQYRLDEHLAGAGARRAARRPADAAIAP